MRLRVAAAAVCAAVVASAVAYAAVSHNTSTSSPAALVAADRLFDALNHDDYRLVCQLTSAHFDGVDVKYYHQTQCEDGMTANFGMTLAVLGGKASWAVVPGSFVQVSPTVATVKVDATFGPDVDHYTATLHLLNGHWKIWSLA